MPASRNIAAVDERVIGIEAHEADQNFEAGTHVGLEQSGQLEGESQGQPRGDQLVDPDDLKSDRFFLPKASLPREGPGPCDQPGQDGLDLVLPGQGQPPLGGYARLAEPGAGRPLAATAPVVRRRHPG